MIKLMAWRPIKADDEGTRWWHAGKRSKFLCDQNLGPDMAPALRSIGYSAIDVWDVRLDGKDDQTIFRYAWKKGLIILTHDRDFLDDRLFPEHANPGIIVLPGGAGRWLPLRQAVLFALPIVSKHPEIWQGSKIHVGENLEVTIRSRDSETGAVTTKKYCIRPQHENALKWIDE